MTSPERLPYGLTLLQRLAVEPMDIAAMARFLQRGQRTVRRILASFRAQGVTLEETVVGGRSHRKLYAVRMPGASGSPGLHLDGLDAIALRLVMARATPQPGEPFHAEVAALETKLRGAVVQPFEGLYEALVRVIAAHPPAPAEQPADPELTEELVDAAHLRQVCDVRYVGGDGLERTYPLHPLFVYERGGRTYVAAWSPTRGEVRSYVLSRFREVTRRRDHFEPPAGFDRDHWLAGPFGVFHDGPWSVRVRFTPELARYVKERTWHPTQVTTDLPDGGVEVQLTAEGRSEILGWVLRFGEHAELLEPPELRAAIAHKLREAAAAYVDVPPAPRKPRRARRKKAG